MERVGEGNGNVGIVGRSLRGVMPYIGMSKLRGVCRILFFFVLFCRVGVGVIGWKIEMDPREGRIFFFLIVPNFR